MSAGGFHRDKGLQGFQGGFLGQGGRPHKRKRKQLQQAGSYEVRVAMNSQSLNAGMLHPTCSCKIGHCIVPITPREAWLHETLKCNHEECALRTSQNTDKIINPTAPNVCIQHNPRPCSAPERTSSTRNCRPNSHAAVHLGPENLKVHAGMYCYMITTETCCRLDENRFYLRE